MKQFVIIGNGAAANSAADTIRKQDNTSKIRMFSRESHGYYYTPALPELIAGEKTLQNLIIHDPQWYEQRDIDLRLDCPVREIDPTRRRVITTRGDQVNYDGLLLAVGGNAFIPPIPGADIPGVFTLRTMFDALRIRDMADKGRRLVLIGGGLLGLEAGNGLRKAGMRVEFVEVFSRLLPRQTDQKGAELLRSLLESMGFIFHLGAATRRISQTGNGLEVRLDNDVILGADMVLLSAGVRPELTLARKLGLDTDKAVLVDDRMQTSLPDVYAAGDVSEHRGQYYGIWPAAVEQGRVAGSNMAGVRMEYGGTVMANSLKVAGIALTAFGEIDHEGRRSAMLYSDPGSGVYRKLVHDKEKILGGVFLGDDHAARTALMAMKRGQPITISEVRALFEG
jgi:nitrite reductase (NADH) large subunit